MPGKLQPDILKQKVLNYTGAHREDLLVGGGLGEDAALIRVPEGILVAASDPVTGAVKGAGSLLVHVNANDIACKGADPSWIVVTLIVPDKLGADFIAATMQEIHETCREMNIAVAGGHTELTDRYDFPVLSATMLGMTKYELSTKNIREGDAVIATGHAGLEGMSIIAHDRPELLEGLFSREELAEICSWKNALSVVKPAKILREFACYMHDPTEGGINGALLETSQACGLGVELLGEKVPVSPLTMRAAKRLDFNPLNLISSGMLLAVVPQESIPQAQAKLSEEGVTSSVIGRFVKGNSSVQLDAHEELWGILAQEQEED
ncbi:MAG: AIR synthase family protein [Synergistaceae bacterium]|nr:AIR synthase family protein [Synergistaceae bacterium]